MIFTRCFGALAARRGFPSVAEVEMKQELASLLDSIESPQGTDRPDDTAA